MSLKKQHLAYQHVEGLLIADMNFKFLGHFLDCAEFLKTSLKFHLARQLTSLFIFMANYCALVSYYYGRLYPN